ncbi:MAG: ATP-binding protein [Pseudomonadota bacterium]
MESIINEQKRMFLLMVIMGGIAIIIGGIVFFMLYQAAFVKQGEWLLGAVQSQARMIETIAQNHTLNFQTNTKNVTEVVVEQLKDVQRNRKEFGSTGEFTIARHEGNQIVFLLSPRCQGVDGLKSILFDSPMAAPMRQALLGKSGIMKGLDYRGITVLAAFEPVEELNMGLVAKIDLAEIREPFIITGALITGIGLLVILLGSLLFYRVIQPLSQRLEEQIRQMETVDHSLRVSEDRFKRIINSNADAIVVTVADIICFANPAAETLFDRPVRELMGRTIGFPVVGKESVDIQIHRPSGEPVSAAMHASPIDWEGEMAHLISLHDITERKRTEEKIRHLNSVIYAIRNVNQLITKEKNRDRLVQGICDNMVSTRGFKSAWITLVDESGVYMQSAEAGIGDPFLAFKAAIETGQIPHCVEEALTHSGLSVAEVTTTTTCSDCPLQPFHRGETLFSLRLEYGQKVYGVLTISVLKTFAGDEEEIGLFQEVGEDIAFALYYLDMEEEKRRAANERKKLEMRLSQAQKMESLGILAGGIAHDFNNILTAILGFAQMALDDVEKNSALEDDLQEIYAGGKRAKDLVKQILTFARQTDETLKPIRIDVIAKEVLKFIRSSIPTTIDITSTIQSDSLIMGNASQVHQIFMNLCTNAAHAMADKGGILDVRLSDVSIDNDPNILNDELKPGNYIEIRVSDTGTGIPPEIMGSIFEPYFTTKDVSEGTGMGLAVVHGILKGYGGTITVDSTVGQGSIFTILIPITGQHETAQLYESKKLPIGTETILVVDDEKSIIKIENRFLTKLGYTVTTSNSSIEALELFRSAPEAYDLVITDLTMPIMTGDKLAAELMKIRPDIPVILYTGYNKPMFDKSLTVSGIKAVASKPIIQADLARIVRNILDEIKDQA